MNPAVFRTWLPARWLNRFAPCAHRSAARRDLPAAVDVDTDIVLRRSGDSAGVAFDRGGAAACRSDADGSADGDGNRPVRAVLVADRRVARSSPQIACLCGRRAVDRVRRGDRAGGLVVWMVVDALALRGRILDRRRQYDGRQRRADRAHPNRAARTIGRSTRQERTGHVRGGSHRSGSRGGVDQTHRRAACPGRGRACCC